MEGLDNDVDELLPTGVASMSTVSTPFVEIKAKYN